MACDDANSKLVDVVTVADVSILLLMFCRGYELKSWSILGR